MYVPKMEEIGPQPIGVEDLKASTVPNGAARPPVMLTGNLALIGIGFR